MSSKLTHFNESGDAHMVDVGDKAVTARRAVTHGWISMLDETLALVESGGHKKGDVLGIARVAGIMAAKKTSELIPLCHPLMLTKVSIDFEIQPDVGRIECTTVVECRERTGVEMEALIATQVALSTIYDMCKAVDRGMTIGDVGLSHKSGGKSGEWNRD